MRTSSIYASNNYTKLQIMEQELYANEIDFGDVNIKILSSIAVQDFPNRCVGVIYA